MSVTLKPSRAFVRIGKGSRQVTLAERPSLRVTLSGSRGLPGPPGPPGGTYDHVQAVASAEWTVPHNLGFRPNVSAFTDGGLLRFVEVLHQNENLLTIRFKGAVTGRATCS